ncbi:hypothetical protein T492DRAFT_917639 [Pavlovales sp. CCMP2436]|nr:hypothetical protein T492DRAFT_917639 [Pavlovales sp. CCMP2436]
MACFAELPHVPFMSVEKPNVLVVMATGKMGRAACEAFRAAGYTVFGTSRDGANPSSAAFCDICPADVAIVHSKLEVEKLAQKVGLNALTILRPVSYFENVDQPNYYNPLKKGSLKDLHQPKTLLSWVSTADVARAAVAVANDAHHWNGKILTCSSCNATPLELAAALSAASGVPVKYSVAISQFALHWLLFPFYKFVVFMNKNPPPLADSAPFLSLVPDAVGPAEFFKKLGKWSNGEVFAPKTIAK